MAQPNQPTPERAAQGAGKSIPIEDDRPADAKAQPQARPAAAEAAPQGEAIEAEVIEDAGPSADEQVAQAKAEAQDWQDKYLRLHAEWDTYRRRTTEQREVEKARATEKLVTSLLPVIDDFERTIDYATKNGEGGLFDGVKAVHAKLVDVLKKDGVEVIDPAGEAFDALEAQAVATVDDASVPDETVSEVYQRGYKMGTKVLRPAMVTVTSGGPKREKPQEDAEK
ncbi:nucleotide exchange factor GrpE [Eggerthella lenta]|uniref:Protein GrpE n=1 Tax=Eggerthella lenta TaxID=84112 RepID=A0ABD7GI14_EGGLN|nr:nucleotide exchange factor GrpE [Eggerthella lenta]RDC36611.1 nucleotide exchange factor GrpE [Eggerthella lenta]RDC37593.1 nucleotide exchange factor GrpE [Eggerthella lenta]